ncbi:MAG: hydantoinase/oxoprolinase family protein [Gemmobacter sp.]|nr:hydantoinase/oxoprolinase family protein [Gemmobacter sp.]
MIRLGVDIGGTFTDFALVESGQGRTAVHKQLTTPDDPARAVTEGVAAICAGFGITPADITEIVHGTTLVTNALIERRGARVGMLVTEGFRDTFDVGMEQRYDLFDLRLRYPDPLVPRALRKEIHERLRHDGSVMIPLDEAAAMQAVDDLVQQGGIDALAICLLHSYANDAHERRLADLVAARYGDLHVSTSAEVFGYPREYERWTTTCANSYAKPLVHGYLARLELGLAGIGFAGHLAIIASGGGLMTPETARRFPVRLLESGPAAGVLMAARLGRDLGLGDVLGFDLGGTTAKGALVRGGRPDKKYEFEAAHVHNHKSGSGLRLRIPVIDMSEIGAGGGSIVARDELGRMRVGPRSAGAMPGPAAYGRGGTEATLTDANLLLGYLDPAFFLGGKMTLDPGLSHTAMQIAAQAANLEVTRTAWGVHDIANEDISRAFRMHATERGFDYRGSVMVASGGGGPVHGARIARKLLVPQVLFPAGAGVMSAFGMLAGAVSFEVMASVRARLDTLTDAALDQVIAPRQAEVAAYLAASGIAAGDIRYDRRLDMRYAGQGHDIEVAMPDGCAVADLAGLFATAYRAEFGTLLDLPVEIVSLKIDGAGPAPASVAVTGYGGDRDPKGATKGHRRAYFPLAGGMIDCPVYDRYLLASGAVLTGPCLIEENESTVLLDVGDRGVVDSAGNIKAQIGAAA